MVSDEIRLNDQAVGKIDKSTRKCTGKVAVKLKERMSGKALIHCFRFTPRTAWAVHGSSGQWCFGYRARSSFLTS
jgi:hypothetical protein